MYIVSGVRTQHYIDQKACTMFLSVTPSKKDLSVLLCVYQCTVTKRKMKIQNNKKRIMTMSTLCVGHLNYQILVNFCFVATF